MTTSARHLINLSGAHLNVSNVPGVGFVGGLLSPGAVIKTDFMILSAISSRTFADPAAREFAELTNSGRLTVVTPEQQ